MPNPAHIAGIVSLEPFLNVSGGIAQLGIAGVICAN